MEHTLISAARQGDVNALYAAIGRKPSILEEFNKVPFSTTPLHMAAVVGKTDFAIEIMVLMPSLARKLDQSGYSPMHLALMNGHEEVARELLAMDAELARVKGRERKTPLHYAAERGYTTVLGEMLESCSDSIKDLTARKESALHVAVQNNHYEVFKIMVKWIESSRKYQEVFSWKNREGNTFLHLAALGQQLQMIKLLGRTCKGWKASVNDINANGWTALDILIQNPTEHNTKEIQGILRRCGATQAQGCNSFRTFCTNQMKLRYFYCLPDIDVPDSTRDALLVVTGLIITTIFQNGANPPGGFWQDDAGLHNAGDPIRLDKDPQSFVVLTAFNITGFLLSFIVIRDLTRRMPMRYLLQGSLICLFSCYILSLGFSPIYMVEALAMLLVGLCAIKLVRIIRRRQYIGVV